MVCPEPTGDLLAVAGLSVTYSRQSRPTINRVIFSVPSGEFVAVTGESGSGKSTLAWAVLGVLPPGARQQGSVRLGGIELTSADEHVRRSIRSRQIAVVFQEPRTEWHKSSTLSEQDHLCYVRGNYDSASRLGTTNITTFRLEELWVRQDSRSTSGVTRDPL